MLEIKSIRMLFKRGELVSEISDILAESLLYFSESFLKFSLHPYLLKRDLFKVMKTIDLLKIMLLTTFILKALIFSSLI